MFSFCCHLFSYWSKCLHCLIKLITSMHWKNVILTKTDILTNFHVSYEKIVKIEFDETFFDYRQTIHLVLVCLMLWGKMVQTTSMQALLM